MFRISYPISENILKALSRYQNIASKLKISSDENSELEIVRLLDNLHYTHIKRLVQLIDDNFSVAGEIGVRIVRSKDPFDFNQAISELFLFQHLFNRVEDKVVPTTKVGSQKVWDLTTNMEGIESRIEIYTPVELVGYQLFKTILQTMLKYMDLPFGYDLIVQIKTISSEDGYNSKDLFYTYTIGNLDEVNDWLSNYYESVKNWMNRIQESKLIDSELTILGPGNRITITAKISKLYDDPQARDIIIKLPTQSSDTTLFFNVGNVENWAQYEWGKKIKKKLFDEQCGEKSSSHFRILLINFMLADTGWPHFISEEWFTTNFNGLIHYLVNQEIPYDVVIPAQLGIKSCFGEPVSIGEETMDLSQRIIPLLGLDIPCKPTEADTQQEQINELIKGAN